jgi:hypothetical protein
MSGATFTADALLSIGMEPSMSPLARLLMLATERSDRTGLASFDPGELSDLLADVTTEALQPQDHIRQGVRVGYFLSGSTEAIQLDTSKIQPAGYPEVGARYGDLTLVREVGEGIWFCKCACGSTRTFRVEYLASGITTRCNNTSKGSRLKHRQSTA